VVIRKKIGTNESVLYGSLRGKEAVEREPPSREDLSPEAEDYPLLEPLPGNV
jgi:hypothetical protein